MSGGRPQVPAYSARQLAALAPKQGVRPLMSLGRYVRAAEETWRQVRIYRAEGDMQNLYVYILRYTSLVIDTLPQHRDYASPEHAPAIASLRGRLPDLIGEAEALCAAINARYEQQRQAMAPAPLGRIERALSAAMPPAAPAVGGVAPWAAMSPVPRSHSVGVAAPAAAVGSQALGGAVPLGPLGADGRPLPPWLIAEAAAPSAPPLPSASSMDEERWDVLGWGGSAPNAGPTGGPGARSVPALASRPPGLMNLDLMSASADEIAAASERRQAAYGALMPAGPRDGGAASPGSAASSAAALVASFAIPRPSSQAMQRHAIMPSSGTSTSLSGGSSSHFALSPGAAALPPPYPDFARGPVRMAPWPPEPQPGPQPSIRLSPQAVPVELRPADRGGPSPGALALAPPPSPPSPRPRSPPSGPLGEPLPGPGAPGSGGLKPLHISLRVLDDFLRVASANTSRNLETCAVLAGTLRRGVFAITTLIIPKQEATSDSCSTLAEEEIFAAQDERELFSLGWIHTHPSQSCFMSSIDLHTHCAYQTMMEEAVAVVMAPTDPHRRYGIFRLTTPDGLRLVQDCPHRGFHPHPATPSGSPLYEICGHVYLDEGLKAEVLDLRKI